MNLPEDEQPLPPISIEASRLSEEAFTGIIEAYIMRSGTDYGTVETLHETKIAQVKKQINKKEVEIVYDPNTESVTLLTAQEYRAAIKNSN